MGLIRSVILVDVCFVHEYEQYIGDGFNRSSFGSVVRWRPRQGSCMIMILH